LGNGLFISTCKLKDRFPHLTYSCCPVHIAALVFNKSSECLSMVNQNPDFWEFIEYSKENQSNYIQLSQHQTRTHYYYRELDVSQFNIPSGSYEIEFWYRSSSSNDYNRESDSLIDIQSFIWDNSIKERYNFSVGNSDLLSIKTINPVVTAVYDKINREVTIVSWLSSGGQFISNVKSLEVKWINIEDQEEVMSEFLTTSQITPGIFKVSIGNIIIQPDRIFPLIATIKDANDITYTSCTSVVSYD
jgi:hypothetical protein